MKSIPSSGDPSFTPTPHASQLDVPFFLMQFRRRRSSCLSGKGRTVPSFLHERRERRRRRRKRVRPGFELQMNIELRQVLDSTSSSSLLTHNDRSFFSLPFFASLSLEERLRVRETRGQEIEDEGRHVLQNPLHPAIHVCFRLILETQASLHLLQDERRTSGEEIQWSRTCSH